LVNATINEPKRLDFTSDEFHGDSLEEQMSQLSTQHEDQAAATAATAESSSSSAGSNSVGTGCF
jgi:hypothetical protein